ncbi:MAG TPA: ATP-binding protein [Pyrinomonadaceae bacterium]|jgi:two-component system sensor histidine kinase PilS (NtrC family)
MAATLVQTGGAAGALKRRLWWLVGARFAFAGALLLLHLRFGAGGAGGPRAVGAVALALSLGYAAALWFTRRRLAWLAGWQLGADVLLVSWLVAVSGDLRSPFAALYIVVISVASIFLGVRGALITSVGCALCYTCVMLGLGFGWLTGVPAEATAATTAAVAGTTALYVAAFLFVGLLAAQLAARQTRSDVQLIEAEHALASLRALHERIVESIRSGVITTDLAGRVYTVNAAAEEMTGYAAERLRGQEASILFAGLPGQIEESLRAAAAGEPSPRYESDCLTPEGLRVRLGYTISPLAGDGGHTSGLVISFQDLTHVRALEATSRRQDKLAAVGRVAAGIAHEIRNPLAAMRGAIQVLHSEVDGDPAQAELMEIILRESDRLNQIITDFLTYARPRRGELTETDVREALRETFTLLRHSPETRPDHVIEEAYADEPLRALADGPGLRQVFWNLARNALSAMPAGGRLTVELRRAAPGRLRITFTDTGRGMTPEQVERLFEPFSSSTTGGTGLGLSIVYQIIRDHGGTINVRSREGHGTTIIIELPEKQN